MLRSLRLEIGLQALMVFFFLAGNSVFASPHEAWKNAAMQRIERVRQKLAWLTGNPYQPSGALKILKKQAEARQAANKAKKKPKAKPVKPSVKGERRLSARGKRPGIRYRCRFCRIYTPQNCPRCRLPRR